MKQRHLFLSYLLIWSVLAINPRYRDDWLLENILVAVAVPLVVWLHRRYHFSLLSALLLWIFFVLHSFGAHYTYAETPWFSLLGQLLHLSRNHFDRVVHFLFGGLLFLPLTEILRHHLPRRGLQVGFALLLLFSSSGMYEILEWLAAEITHPELGTAFLGTQGDPWDAQKDMALAHLGSLIAALIYGLATVNTRGGRRAR